MSWENENYAPNSGIGSKAKSSSKRNTSKRSANSRSSTKKASNKSLNKSSKNSNISNVLEYSNKNLKEFPVDDPNWATATILLMESNNLEVLDASQLPRRLQLLDLRNNKIREVKGTFPDTLETLWLDENKLEYSPTIPSSIKHFTIYENPLKQITIKDIIKDETNLKTKKIYWFTPHTNRGLFKKYELDQLHIHFKSDKEFEVIKDTMDLILNKNTVCREKISHSYINEIRKTTQHIILEVYNDEVVAFAILNITESYIKVDIICSDLSNKGGGSRIMNIIQAYFEGHKKLQKIILQSVADARAFYEKKGFVPCIRGEMCPMEYIRHQRLRRASV
jgi:predicted GNAT family N-acyltransferase